MKQGNALTSYVGYSSSSKGSTSEGEDVPAEQLNLLAYAGDMFTIYAENTGNADVTCRVSFNWIEV